MTILERSLQMLRHLKLSSIYPLKSLTRQPSRLNYFQPLRNPSHKSRVPESRHRHRKGVFSPWNVHPTTQNYAQIPCSTQYHPIILAFAFGVQHSDDAEISPDSESPSEHIRTIAGFCKRDWRTTPTVPAMHGRPELIKFSVLRSRWATSTRTGTLINAHLWSFTKPKQIERTAWARRKIQIESPDPPEIHLDPQASQSLLLNMSRAGINLGKRDLMSIWTAETNKRRTSSVAFDRQTTGSRCDGGKGGRLQSHSRDEAHLQETISDMRKPGRVSGIT
jgi:hypothetical protein